MFLRGRAVKYEVIPLDHILCNCYFSTMSTRFNLIYYWIILTMTHSYYFQKMRWHFRNNKVWLWGRNTAVISSRFYSPFVAVLLLFEGYPSCQPLLFEKRYISHIVYCLSASRGKPTEQLALTQLLLALNYSFICVGVRWRQ